MAAALIGQLAILAVVAAALATCIYLFATVKRECAEQRRAAAERAESLAGALRQLEARIAEVERDLEGTPSIAAAGSGMNLNRRTQALRLIRKGEAPDRIAAVLSLPLKEVELLSKVNRVASERITSLPRGPA